MINRTLIRLKIVQLIYSFYQNGGKDIKTAEKELMFSLSKAYDLYNYLLLLLVELTKYESEQIEQQEELNKIAHKEEAVSHRFVNNRFVKQLADNKQLLEYVDSQKRTWLNDADYLKKLLADIKASDTYADYMVNEVDDYSTDREFWRKIYKSIIMKDDRLSEVLEDKSLYWNDDREIVDTFVLKTIKRFEEENKENQELLPEYKDEEDREFAVKLFRTTILNDEDHRRLIAQCVKNWEFDRLAFMDVVIMQIAIAEILGFVQIPTVVSINEYVDIAKYYSTPKSAAYVNGILDAVVKRLKREKLIIKD
ncbi:MAG: transcription antitermination factor NusB [Bacteroidaceae bacterium]|jgi:N utilization substance protein B